jgi:hypothetical protein
MLELSDWLKVYVVFQVVMHLTLPLAWATVKLIEALK